MDEQTVAPPFFKIPPSPSPMSDDSAPPLPPFVKTLGMFLAVWMLAYWLVSVGLAQTPLPEWLGEEHTGTTCLVLGGYLTWLIRGRKWLPASWHYLPLLSGIFTLLELPVSGLKRMFISFFRRIFPAPPPQVVDPNYVDETEEFLREVEEDYPEMHARVMKREQLRNRADESESDDES